MVDFLRRKISLSNTAELQHLHCFDGVLSYVGPLTMLVNMSLSGAEHGSHLVACLAQLSITFCLEMQYSMSTFALHADSCVGFEPLISPSLPDTCSFFILFSMTKVCGCSGFGKTNWTLAEHDNFEGSTLLYN